KHHDQIRAVGGHVLIHLSKGSLQLAVAPWPLELNTNARALGPPHMEVDLQRVSVRHRIFGMYTALSEEFDHLAVERFIVVAFTLTPSPNRIPRDEWQDELLVE